MCEHHKNWVLYKLCTAIWQAATQAHAMLNRNSESSPGVHRELQYWSRGPVVDCFAGDVVSVTKALERKRSTHMLESLHLGYVIACHRKKRGPKLFTAYAMKSPKIKINRLVTMKFISRRMH